jgi:hypothetical protein
MELPLCDLSPPELKQIPVLKPREIENVRADVSLQNVPLQLSCIDGQYL